MDDNTEIENETTSTTSTSADDDSYDSTAMITKRLLIIDDLDIELNILKEQFDDALENDPEYQAIQELEAALKDEVKEKKAKLLAKQSYMKMSEQIKEKRTDIKENKEALSLDLVEYYKENNTIEIKDQNGDTKRMRFNVKLVN